MPVGDLLGEGAVLLLRWHGRGDGLPMPTMPSSATAAADDESAAVQWNQIVIEAARVTSTYPAPSTPIGDYQLDDEAEDEDDDEVEEMLQHPDPHLAAAGFRVPRSVGIPRPLVIEDAALIAIPKSPSTIERHAMTPNEGSVVDLGDSPPPIGQSTPAASTPNGDDDELEQDPLLAEAGIRVRRRAGPR